MPKDRSYCIVSVGNGFGQPLGVVAVACGITDGGGDADEVVKEPHTLYIRTKGFVRGYDLLNKFIEYPN